MGQDRIIRYFQYRNPAGMQNTTDVSTGSDTLKAYCSDATTLANYKTAKEANPTGTNEEDYTDLYQGGNANELVESMIISANSTDQETVFPLTTFSDVDDAKTKVGIVNGLLTANSPTVTYSLEDSNKTLAVSFGFADGTARDAHKSAWGTAWASGKSSVCNYGVIWTKTVFMNPDDTVAGTYDPNTGLAI